MTFKLIFLITSTSLLTIAQSSVNIHNGHCQMWKELILNQKTFINIINICSKGLCCVEDRYSSSNVELDYFSEDIMVKIQKSTVESNKRALFIVNSKSSSYYQMKNTIKTIRKYNGNDPIVIFTDYFLDITYNLFLVVSSITGYDMYETCSYCDSGKDSMVKINSWSRKRGFKSDVVFMPSFKGKFNGHTLVFGCIPTPVVTFVVGKDKQGNVIWAGCEIDILSILSTLMKFKLAVSVPKNKIWGSVVNNTPTGLLRMVAYGLADVAGGSLTTSYDRYQFVDFSPGIGSTIFVLISDRPQKGLKFLSFLQPLTAYVWLLLFLSIPVSAFALYILDKFSPISDQLSLFKYIWEMSKVVLWDTTVMKSGSWSKTFYLSVYMLCTTVVIFSYLGTLTGFITNEPYLRKPINKFQQFIDSDLKLILVEGSVTSQFFNTKQLENRKVFIKQQGFAVTTKTALQSLLDTPNTYVFAWPKNIVEAYISFYFTDTDREHQFYFAKEILGRLTAVFFMQKSTVYKEDFILNMLYIKQSGITDHLVNKWISVFHARGRAMAKKQQRKPEPKPTKTIKLKHLSGTFTFLVSFYLISLTIFVIEVLSQYLSYFSHK